MQSIKNKIIAILLITVIAVGNITCIGGNITTSYASNSSLESQNKVTNNENIEFDAYFIKENETTHSINSNIAEKAELYLDLQIKGTGYLKEATIQANANFKVDETYKKDEINKIENNKIELNQINGNSKTIIVLPIYFDVNEKVNIANFSKQNKIILNGTYIDDAGKEHKIEKTILNQLTWSANPEEQIQQQIQKYVPYQTEEGLGIIIEQKVKMQIKDGVLPIAETNMEIVVPEIQNIMPKITIRKESQTNFSAYNWNYNQQSGKLIINETNIPSESGEISWISQEEYIITYRYENAKMQEELIFPCKISSNSKIYGGETQSVAKTYQEDNKLTETIGQIIELQAQIENQNISKGYLYTNLENSEKLEITYKTNYGIDIAYSKIADEITLTLNQEQWVMQEEKIPANTYFEQISINKENFKEILSEEGYITILSNNNKEIGKITLIDNEEEMLTINIAEHNLASITLKTSKPQKEGILNIIADKKIKAENSMLKETIQNITALENVANMQVMKQEKEILKDTKTAIVSMVEPTSKINVEISKTQFSTLVESEEVEIRATLKTNTEYDSLYQNPSIDIILPKDIESVEILGTELLYEDELKIESTQLIDETNKIIRINLKGNQTKYSLNEVATGATIVVRANLKINNLTPTKSEKIEVLYTNQKSSQYETTSQEGRGISKINIRYIAPTGVVPINTISNYVESKIVRSIAGSSEQGILEVSSSAKLATSEIELINNYTNKINNIRILGRTLTTNTTDTQTNEDLNNTFDAPMLTAITSEKLTQEQYKVYYSENGEATEQLNESSNGWTLTPEDLSKVKSYLIVLPNFEMNTADSIKFSYQMQIPEGLNYNEKVNSVYTAYFDNVKEEQTIEDSVKAVGASLTTGQAPELETELTSYSQENSTVREGQYIKFKANVKNTGTMDAENVKLNVVAPSGNIYYYIENQKIYFTENLNGKQGTLVATYKTKNTEFVEDDFTSEYVDIEEANRSILLGTLKAGESKQIEYELKIEDVTIITKNLPAQNGALLQPEIVINNTVEVISDKMPKAITSNQYKLILKEATMQVIASSDKASDYILTKGNEITYTTQIENISATSTLKQLEVTVKIPEGLTIKEAKTENRVETNQNKIIDINTNQNTVTFKMNEYTQSDAIDFIVVANVENISNETQTISPVITAKAEGTEEHTANILSNKIQVINLSIEQQKLDKEYFKEVEEITYTYKIKNNSQVYVDSIKFENEIPEGTTFKEALIGAQVIKEIEENKLVIETELLEGEEITVQLTLITNKLEEGQTEKKIENYATIEADLFEKIESNHITSIIEYDATLHNSISDADEDNYEEEEETDIQAQEGRYIISGTAWIDSNKNGERDEDEKTLEDLTVRLVNQENQLPVKDVDTQEEKITTTSAEGKYTFANLEKGKYVVVFEYNNVEYELTQYQKDEISKLVNSDAISMEMNIDGKEKIVAVSDTIDIIDRNIRNIDIGMYIAAKSDLSLEKYISKVSVAYGDTTKTYEYNNEKTAKVEIPGKNISEATIIVEYKIVVKNEGDIANYVKKIVDYIPNDMKFSAELNKDWYQSSNGDLYNSSLANVELQPGESKEITLTLTKKKTSDSAEIINNNAEIYEVYNQEGISDIDSTPANKVTKEDDMSSADLVISVKTGEIVALVGIISMAICVAIVALACVSYKKIKKIIWRG